MFEYIRTKNALQNKTYLPFRKNINKNVLIFCMYLLNFVFCIYIVYT